MKKIVVLLLAGAVFSTAYAQSEEEDYAVILPDEAQKCILPAAPDAIPPDADYDTLVVAKGHVADFQAGLEVYRTCMKDAENGANLTAGNKQALVASYNYSVDMEERVAQRFNAAIKSYKERTAAQ